MNRHMIASVRTFSAVAFAAFLVLPGGPAFCAETGEIVIHSGRVDVNHGIGTEPIDQLDIAITFTNTESSEHGACHKTDNPVSHGLVVSLQEGACGTTLPPVVVTIPKFKPISPNSTFAKFEGITKENASADALLRTLPKPNGVCGLYNLTLDALPLDMSSITANPVALSITLADGSTGCVTVSNAIIE
jgi:hypothetical protein